MTFISLSSVAEATAYAQWFIRTTGKKIMLGANQWLQAEQAGLDMTLFERIKLIPAGTERGRECVTRP